MARAQRRQDITTLIKCHIHPLEYFGGVPECILYDNLKPVVLGRDHGGRPVWNEKFLPFQKTLDQFDFSFQPSIDERQMRELATLSFMQEAANVILLGPPGVGKTHLAVALAIEAIRYGIGVYFVTAHALVEDPRKVYADQRLERRMRVYLAPKVLIIDEVGYLPFDSVGATMLFQLVSARYERGILGVST